MLCTLSPVPLPQALCSCSWSPPGKRLLHQAYRQQTAETNHIQLAIISLTRKHAARPQNTLAQMTPAVGRTLPGLANRQLPRLEEAK